MRVKTLKYSSHFWLDATTQWRNLAFFQKRKREETKSGYYETKKNKYSILKKKKAKMAKFNKDKNRRYTLILNPSTLVKHFLYSKELREFP
jgi:hypothetical protein